MPGFEGGKTPLFVYERVVQKLALISGQRIGVTRHPNQRHVTYRELVNGLEEQEKPCFVVSRMKCTNKTNKGAETALLKALRPPLDANTKGDGGELYAVWASKAVVDKFYAKIKEKVSCRAAASNR